MTEFTRNYVDFRMMIKFLINNIKNFKKRAPREERIYFTDTLTFYHR